MPHAHATASPFIARHAALIRADSRVLDLAAGTGRHARLMASRGARVLAVDRDAAALAAIGAHPGIETRVLDLETGVWPLAGETFDAIIVTNYLHRPHFPHLRDALAPDGVVLYETFAIGNEHFGRPANPEFLLRDGELLAFAAATSAPLRVVAYEQGRVDHDGRTSVIARMAAVGPGYPWPPVLAPPAS